jgi:lactate permease
MTAATAMPVAHAGDGGHSGRMLLIDALPLVALVVLLATGRVGPLLACACAIALTLPAAVLAGADLLPFAGRSAVEGLWLAVIPVGIISGGLLFHAAIGNAPAQEASQAASADLAFTCAFLLGPFAETVTGFGVGTVFAIGTLRRAGLSGVPAAAIGLLPQALIPWGGLGPGTAVGAALAGVPPQAMAARGAVQVAAGLLLLLPLFWHFARRAGLALIPRQCLAQAGWVVAVGALLIALHRVVPWEVCGLLATGPLLSLKLLRAHPPQGRAGWVRALAGAGPYALLAAMLLGTRLWHGAPAWQPFASLPNLPLNHAMVALWLAALGFASRAPHPGRLFRTVAQRGWRPAAALLMFVLLARFLANAGVPQTLAGALAGAFGQAAPYAAPLLAGVSGFFAGTNVGSNSAMMPLQAALGHVAGLGATVLPAVQNGTLFLALSPQMCAIACGLAGGAPTPVGIWRLTWPVFAISVLIGMASIAIG